MVTAGAAPNSAIAFKHLSLQKLCLYQASKALQAHLLTAAGSLLVMEAIRSFKRQWRMQNLCLVALAKHTCQKYSMPAKTAPPRSS